MKLHKNLLAALVAALLAFGAVACETEGAEEPAGGVGTEEAPLGGTEEAPLGEDPLVTPTE